MLAFIGVLAILLIVGVSAASIWVAWQNPEFYVKIIRKIILWVLPEIWDMLLQRMPPEKEAEWREAMLTGRQWDYANKRVKEWGK